MYRRLVATPLSASRGLAASFHVESRRRLGTASCATFAHSFTRSTTLPFASQNLSLRGFGGWRSNGTVASAQRLCPLWSGTQQRSFFFSGKAKESSKAPTPQASATAPPAADKAEKTSLSLAAAATITADVSQGMPKFSHSTAQAKLEQKLTEMCEYYLEPYDKGYHFLHPFKSSTPMVMLLGNHSSGKSTLINYLADREIQETGVAPTDDGFTIIKRDTFDMDADGPSVVSNPRFQYQSLQQFGLPFVTHLKMKTRAMPPTSRLDPDMVFVDTPGMIDTPVHASSAVYGGSNSLHGNDRTRGYDFLAVTRWFAQQSDVILLMFDPANPGTTGETLDVLTKALAGYEHKFLIVMNKADIFEKVTDFARAYGTLCWNLSKVMKMKDIPRVYTTCTPMRKAVTESHAPRPTGTVPEAELSRQRNEILNEVLSAPMRRMDNLVTETEESARNLILALRAAKILRSEYRQRELLLFGALAVGCLGAPAICIALFSAVSLSTTIMVTLLSAALGCAGFMSSVAYLREFEQQLLHNADSTLGKLFNSKTRTAEVELRWHRTVKPEIMRVATTYHDRGGVSGINALPTCSARACRDMEQVIQEKIPVLRRGVSEYKEAFFRNNESAASWHFD